AVANEVVMPHAVRLKSCRAAFHGHFAHQTSLNQIAQIVINRSPGGARICAINSFEDLYCGWMADLPHPECHDSVPLGSAPETATRQGAFDRIYVHERSVFPHM